MRIRLIPAILSVMVVAFPVAVMAASGTVTLSPGQTLNLDTGVTSTSDGDIMWNTSGITPQIKATIANYINDGPSAPTIFAGLNQTSVSTICSVSCNSLAIAASLISTGDIFFVKTSGGNYGAALVTGTNGLVSTVTLQFTTYGSAAAPSIIEVENNYSDIPAGYSNSGIAQGSLFFVFGSGLAIPGTEAVLQNAVGNILPTTINGATITVTVGGTTVTPAMYYAQPTAVAGVLPSNTPLGAGTVTVTYNNQTSNSYNITVVANAMGFLAYDEGGTGLGVAVSASNASLYNYANSIPPGITVILYGSGLGADPKPTRDTTYVGVTSAAADSINSLTHIYVGGVDGGVPGYQGASGYPGLNQINFTIPANAPTGCNVSLVGVNAAGIPTNIVTLPIGTGTCSDPIFGISGAQTQNLGGQISVTSGVLGITSSPLRRAAGRALLRVLTSIASQVPFMPMPPVWSHSVAASLTKARPPQRSPARLPVSMPAPSRYQLSGNPVTLTPVSSSVGQSIAQLPSGYIPTAGGTFTFNGTGGANVSAFNASVVFPNSVLNWTNQNAAASITRSSGLLVAWSGGASGTYVSITGTSAASSSSPLASFTCLAPISAGQFTVPAYILAALPAGSGSVTVNNSTNYQTFTASGLNYGAAQAIVGVQVNSTFN